MTAHPQERPERRYQPKGRVRIAIEHALEGSAEVFALGREPLERLCLAGAAQLAIP